LSHLTGAWLAAFPLRVPSVYRIPDRSLNIAANAIRPAAAGPPGGRSAREVDYGVLRPSAEEGALPSRTWASQPAAYQTITSQYRRTRPTATLGVGVLAARRAPARGSVRSEWSLPRPRFGLVGL
jgi:hypothetical protein